MNSDFGLRISDFRDATLQSEFRNPNFEIETMPIYEYVCQKCARRTEVIQQVGEKFIRICPHCGGRVKKAFAAPAILFKGSGWYVTDYARAKKEEQKAGAEKAEPAEKPAEKKKEAKDQKATKETKETKEKKAAKE